MAAPGKVIVLTGASRGIGLSMAHFLLQKQCRLVVVARSKEPLDRLRADYPDQVQVLSGDLSDFSIGARATALATDTWGRVDGLLINHGVLEPVKQVRDANAEDWRKAFDINLFSAVALVQAALPALRASKGNIVLVSSGAAVTSYTGWGAYGATKAALNHFAQTLGVEEPDVTTVSVRPGVVDTSMQDNIRGVHLEHMSKSDAEKFVGLKQSGGLLKPEQPGNVMARLVLHAPKELSGKFLSWNDKDLASFQDA